MSYKSQEYQKALDARRDRENARKRSSKEQQDMHYGKVKGGFEDSCTCSYSSFAQ